jgi:dTDP-4-dehydrorhamnose 3,5-epimerase
MSNAAQNVKTVQADVAAAASEVEPAFVPAQIFADDRGWSIMNQLQGVMGADGQINYSVMYPGVVKAWHRHQKQTDFWLCTMGHLKVGVHRDDGRTWKAVIGEKRPGVLIIPPPLWHGACTIGPQSAGLLYYVTHAYDPQDPDEERRPFDSVPEFSWAVEFK